MANGSSNQLDGEATDQSQEQTQTQSSNNDVNDNDNANTQGRETSAPATAVAKPGIMAKLGLDVPTLIMMFKGAIAPTVSIAIYQSRAVAEEYTNLGYLIGIIAVLSMTILPRGKFIQTLILNVIFACLGSAVALLMLWSALQARLHTQSSPAAPNSRRPPYNSSQSAVSAIWLFANIWVVNTLRAKHPSLNMPVIIYSIITNITCTYSPMMTSNAASEALVKQLLTAMLAAFGIAMVCSLLIMPVPSRKVTFGQMRGVIMLLRGAVKQEKVYLQSLEREDMFAVPADISAGTESINDHPEAQKGDKDQTQPDATAEAKAIKDAMFQMRQLVGKIYVDLPFAKRDIAMAKLEAKDLTQILTCLRSVIIPIVGMGTVIDIFQRLAEKRGWTTTAETPPEVIAEKNEEKRIWNEVMKQLHEPFEQLSEAIDQGLQHAGMLLEILPRPKTARDGHGEDGTASNDADVESKGNLVVPGDPGFAEFLKGKLKAFHGVQSEILRKWAKERGLLKDDLSTDETGALPFTQTDQEHRRDQTQLYILLFIETLMQAAGSAVLDFVMYADKKVADGTMSKNRLMAPKVKILRKWARSVFADEDKSQEQNADLFDSGLAIVYMGDSFARKRDPEHLPVSNLWQRLGNGLRRISKLLSSEQSGFGFRVACATLTVAITAYLEATHDFFQEQRLVWAMIIISIGMTQTSGESIFGFLCRVLGTVAAMVFSLVTWYIVDRKTPGILVFLYLFLVFEHYFFLKYPQFIPAVMICMVTHVMIIGYELQVRQIGEAVAESTGQPAYPIYELAPYRLACVAGGCLVAFIWTIFPWPVTERTWLRRDLSTTMYLLANYFSVINETLKSKLRGNGGDPNVKGSPAHHLTKHRSRLFGKLMLILPALKKHADFQRWEPTIGGSFPQLLYQDIIRRATRINSYLTLISYTVGGSGSGGPTMRLATQVDGSDDDRADDRAWIQALGTLLADISSTQHSIICTLTLLSNALQSGQSLPPHLSLPRPYELTQQLESMDRAADGHGHGRGHGHASGRKIPTDRDRGRGRRLLDARNMAQKGYAEFAVLQVCSTLVCDDLEGLVRSVSRLVGVVDFSFRVEGVGASSSSSSSNSMMGSVGYSAGNGGGTTDDYDDDDDDDGGKGKGKVD